MDEVANIPQTPAVISCILPQRREYTAAFSVTQNVVQKQCFLFHVYNHNK
jgi:hypothetical protein